MEDYGTIDHRTERARIKPYDQWKTRGLLITADGRKNYLHGRSWVVESHHHSTATPAGVPNITARPHLLPWEGPQGGVRRVGHPRSTTSPCPPPALTQSPGAASAAQSWARPEPTAGTPIPLGGGTAPGGGQQAHGVEGTARRREVPSEQRNATMKREVSVRDARGRFMASSDDR